MKYYMIGLCMTCMVVAVTGCRRDTAEDVIDTDFIRCVGLVKNCNVSAPANVRYALFKKTFDDISAIPNATLKIEKAKQFAGLANEIVLEPKEGNLVEFADSVSRFKTMFDWTIGSLFDAKVEGAYVLHHLITGMDRYRKACFRFPIEGRSAAESVEAYEKKCRVICELASEYEYAMMSLNKAELGHLQALPLELHAKYHDWKRTIPIYPRAKDVREKIHELLVGK